MSTEMSGFRFHHAEVVLIVDDEELLREVVSLMISERGGVPEVAASGIEAMTVFSADPNRFHSVFLDFSMPGMNGFDTWRKMRALKPDLRAVICSGLRITREVEEAWRRRELEFLQKPFLENDLFASLSRLHESKG